MRQALRVCSTSSWGVNWNLPIHPDLGGADRDGLAILRWKESPWRQAIWVFKLFFWATDWYIYTYIYIHAIYILCYIYIIYIIYYIYIIYMLYIWEVFNVFLCETSPRRDPKVPFVARFPGPRQAAHGSKTTSRLLKGTTWHLLWPHPQPKLQRLYEINIYGKNLWNNL